MDGITGNPFADLSGIAFLTLYLVVILVTYLFATWQLRQSDPSRRLPPLAVPASPDPYEIAYLRGGADEVTRAVVFNLLHRRFLTELSATLAFRRRMGRRLERVSDHPELGLLLPIERAVYDCFESRRPLGDLFQPNMRLQLQPYFEPYARRLDEEELLSGSAYRGEAVRIGLLAAAVIVVVGGLRVLAASTDESNVLVAVVGLLALVGLWRVLRVPRLSARGQEYLRQLQLAYAPLRANPALLTNDADMMLLLLVGVYGYGWLHGTPYHGYGSLFEPAGGGREALAAHGGGGEGGFGEGGHGGESGFGGGGFGGGGFGDGGGFGGGCGGGGGGG